MGQRACRTTWATQLYGCCGACNHGNPGSPKRDNRVDIAGYAITLDRLDTGN